MACQVPFRLFKEAFIDTGMAKKGVPAGILKIEDSEQPVDKPFLDNLYIIVTSCTGEKSTSRPAGAQGGS